MNQDGFPDILVCNSASNTLSYFEAIGDGTFKNSFTMNTGREPVALEVGDFNGDGVQDIAISNSSSTIRTECPDISYYLLVPGGNIGTTNETQILSSKLT